MLLNKLKTNHTLNFILFPLIGILFWLKSLIIHETYNFFPGQTDNLLFSPGYSLIKDSVLAGNLVALLLFLLMAAMMLQITSKYDFIRIRTMIPATLFVLIAGGITGLNTMHPVYPGAVFFLIAIYRLFGACEVLRPFSAAFDAGFFLGIACLFYISLVAVIPAFLIGIGILSRESGWRLFFLNLMGIMLPFIFTASYAFYTETIPELIDTIETSILTPVNHFNSNLPLLVYMGIIGLFIILASIKIIRDYDTKKVSTRKFFIVLFLIFICTVAAIFFFPAVSHEMLIISAIPVTFLLTNYFMFLKSRFWSEFLFLFLVIVVVAVNIIS